MNTTGGSLNDIYYTIRDSGGGVVKPVASFTSDTPGETEGYYYPNLTQLSGNRALLVWYRNSNRDVYYAVLGSYGDTVKGATNLSTGSGGWWPDAVELSNGNIVVAWSGSTRFAVLDNSYYRIASPTALSNPAAITGDAYVSAAADSAGHAILTWMDSDSSYRLNLYYALVDSSGNTITPPMIFRTSQGSGTHIETSYEGYGNTSYQGAPISDVGPLEYAGHVVDDDDSGESSGNDDGIVNCGETIELYVDLHNQGSDTATGVNATISTSDPYITWLYNVNSGYPDIPGGGTGRNSNDFDFVLDPDAPDGHRIHFDLDIASSNGGPWVDSFDVQVMCGCNDPHEPNDTPGQATAISYGTTLTDPDICPAGDVDYYSFVGHVGDTIIADIDASAIGSSLDSYLYLYAADGITELVRNDDYDGVDSHIEYLLPSDGTYYLKVREYSHPNEGGMDYFYHISLSLLPPPFDIDVPWRPSSPPTVDGQISLGEWDDAALYDITNVGSPGYRQHALAVEALSEILLPGQAQQQMSSVALRDLLSTVILYAKHDGTHLYLAMDNPNDTTQDDYDQMGVYFDDNPLPSDGQWTNTSCGHPDGEGNFWVLDNSVEYREWIAGPATCDVVEPAPGTAGAVGYGSGHAQAEIAIDLTSSALRAIPGDAISMYMWIYNESTEAFDGQWPSTADFQDPSTYGTVTLATGGVPDIEVIIIPSPPLEVTLPPGQSTQRTMTIRNVGQGPLDFYIIINETVGSAASSIGSLLISVPPSTLSPAQIRETESQPGVWEKTTGYGFVFEEVPILANDSVDVLLVYADDYPTQLQAFLQGFPDIRAVDTWDAYSSIPGLGDLTPYDIVVAWNNAPWYDPDLIGDVLADYHDAGGSVILTVDCWSAGTYRTGGRLITQQYSPFSSLGGAVFNDVLLGWYDDTHPLMDDVGSAAAHFHNQVELNPGAQLIAEWDDGMPFVATKETGGKEIVAVNTHYGDSAPAWSTDAPLIVHNAIVYLLTDDVIPWLSVSPSSGTVIPGGSQDVIVTFDATELSAGTYTANIIIANNDPDENPVIVPATLHVIEGNVDLSIVPSPKTVAVDEIFTVDIQVDAGSQPVDAVDAYLSFDRNYLRVVDASGNETNSIIPGSTLPVVLQNSVDNGSGRITFSAGKQLGSPSPSGTFVLATIRFKALAENSGTAVGFLSGTDVFYEGNSILGSTHDGTVVIIRPFRGEVILQGRGSAGDPRWENFPLRVTFYPPGSSTPTGTYNATTDRDGVFSISGISPGAYDVEVKNAHTLSRMRVNVTVPPATEPVHFCTLLEGDANDDDRVAGADFSILATVYGKCQGDTGYDGRADFNGDGCIGGADFSLLATNYGQQGPVPCSGASALSSTRRTAGTVDISVQPPSTSVSVDEIFTVDIQVDAGSQLVDAVDAYLSFDRNYLRVVGASGNESNSIIAGSTLPLVLQNGADNSTGHITYSAGKQLGSPSPGGTFVLATIRFKAVAETPPEGTPIVFLNGTDVFYQGDSVLGSLADGNTVITSTPEVKVHIVPPSRTVSAGETFTLDVMIGDVTDLGAYEFCLAYDPSVVSVGDIADGGFLGSTGRTVIPIGPDIDNEMGTACFGAFSMGTPAGPDGSGTLAVITLTAEDNPGICGDISLFDVQVTDTSASVQSVSTEDGEVCIIACQPVQGASFTYSPTEPWAEEPTAFQGTVAAGSDPITYDWVFDDGHTSTGQTVAHTYAIGNDYVVLMTAANDCGSDTFSETIRATLRYDFDRDCDVDIVDIMAAASRWGCACGAPCYDPLYDTDGDCDIDIVDIMAAAARWGWACGQPDPAQASGLAVPRSGMKVRVEPDSSTAVLGEVFTVTLQIEEAVNLGGFELAMSFDPVVVRVEDATLGDSLGSTGRNTVLLGPEIDNHAGKVIFGGFSFGSQAGPNDTGGLAILTLIAQDIGNSLFRLEDVQVTDTGGQAQTVTIEDGRVIVTGRQRVYLPMIGEGTHP